jgi:hypothetical protein
MSGIRRAVQRSPLAALNGENSCAKVENVREDSSALNLEILALRHQLAVLNRSRPSRLRLTAAAPQARSSPQPSRTERSGVA